MTDLIGAELQANRMPESARPALLAVGEATAGVERSDVLNAEVVLNQLRAVIVDLLQLTGMGQYEATDALPTLS